MEPGAGGGGDAGDGGAVLRPARDLVHAVVADRAGADDIQPRLGLFIKPRG